MTFANEIKKTANEPITVVHIEPKQRLISDWVNSAGTVYYIDLDYFVIDCSEDGASLTEAASSSVSTDEWFFDADVKRLWLDVGEDPSGTFIHATYRLFFSDRPLDFPYDMASGKEVPYVALLENTSKFKDEIDPDDLVGISLSGTGSIKFKNDSSWNGIYSKLFWETCAVKIYLGFPDLAASAFQLIYKGFINSKAYSSSRITFGLKDFIEKLRSEVPLDLFDDADGDITEQGKAKRRIYGRTKVLGVSLDKIKDGFELTYSSFSKTDTREITGVGSSFLSETTPEDVLFYTDSTGNVVEYSIESVDSDTVLTLTEDINSPDAAATLNLLPNSGTPIRNRNFFICNHPMKEPATTVSSSLKSRFLTVADSTNFFAGDTIKVDGNLATITTVSENNLIILESDLPSNPSGGETVVKQSVSNVWYNETLLVADRDYTLTNSTPSKVVLDGDMEFNIAKPQPVTDGSSTALTFTNSSRDVTGNVAFRNFFKPWDWVRSNDLAHTTWYEILEVQEDKLVLRTAYAGTNRTNDGERKRVNIVDDESRILIDALGITENGAKTGVWVKTAAQVTKHLLTEGGLTVNAASFTQASLDAPYLVSLAVPLAGRSSRPSVRGVIDLVNKTVLGSLHENADRELVYNVLSPRKAAIDTIFRQDDVINYSFESTGKNIAKAITVKYRHEDANIFTGEADALVEEVSNEFITKVTDIQREEQLDFYIWDQASAQTLAQRISLLRENANTVIKFDSNTLFLDRSLNELVYLEIRDMFERFGTEADKNFIGVINLLTKGSGKSTIEVTDLGGFYNKIANFAASSAVAYSSADIVDKAKNGYYTDSNGIISTSREYRLNLYG